MALKNRRVFELRLGKSGLILFIGGMSVLLFSGFLFGIFIGKHMEAYPERYSTGIAKLFDNRLLTPLPPAGATASPEAEQGRKEDPRSTDAEIALAGEESPTGSKEAVAPESRPVAEKNRTSEANAGPSPPAEDTPRPSIAASGGKTVEANRSLLVVGGEGAVTKVVPSLEIKPSGDAKVKKPPAAETATPQKGRYEVQAAAYRERAQADKLVKKFGELGLSSQVVMKEIPGKGQWFRVIVGGFENREKAQEAVDQMTGKVRGLKCVIRPVVKKENGG